MPRRYRAPQKNGELFIDPPFDAVPGLIEENRRKLDRDDVRIGDNSLQGLRYESRMTVTGVPLNKPIILTGHQPELFHPGVWVKNFAAVGISDRVNGRAAFLTVDNDAVHSTVLPVPLVNRYPNQIRIQQIPFDRTEPDVTYEFRPIYDLDQFCTLGDRLLPLFEHWRFRPLLPSIWKHFKRDATWEKPKQEFLLADILTQTRQNFEEEIGLFLPPSSISDLTHNYPWSVFVNHLLADADRFAAIHNAALADYRKRNKLRSRTHPFPDLAPNEAPFWVLDEDGKRKRCFVPYTGDPKAIRPRALTLTLFARLILGDFFIHGIGGGKYDEVTDQIIRDYFGIDPPAYQVVSGTLHLPFPLFPHSGRDVKQLERTLRDLHWNPHRHLTFEQKARPDIAAMLKKQEALVRMRPISRGDRRQHFRDQRAVLHDLQPFVADRVGEIERELAVARTEAAANAVLTRRDYSWVLYPKDVLFPFLKRVQSLAAGV
ncbi:MAG TPA: hypothetical protein VGJ05_19625 [Fimbriiglobus sp.]|jgi:hypothetical protein